MNLEKIKRQKSKLIILSVILIILIILLLIEGCSVFNKTENENPFVFELDGDSEKGGWEEGDKQALIDSLNQKVKEGMINISINASPVFETGESKGNLMIVNEEINRYPQTVEIVLNETGETIYSSKGIPVGSKITNAKLSKNLSKGKYDCTAYFHSVDPDTGKIIGTAGAEITITVKN